MHENEPWGAPLIELLNRLLAIDLDALEAYESALERLEHPPDRDHLVTLLDEQRRHVDALSEAITRYGGRPCEKGDLTSILSKGKVLLGSLLGDQAILRVLRANEEDATLAYIRAAEEPLPGTCVELIQRKLEDVRRRRGWLVRRLGVLEQVMEP